MIGYRAQVCSPTPMLLTLGLIALLQFHAVATAPVGSMDESYKKSDQNGTPVSRMYKRSNDVTVIFMSTCAGHGSHEFIIAREKNGCINIDKPSLEQTIKTNPDGIRLRVFDQPHCDGNSQFYHSGGENTSEKKSSHLKLPFPVSSFQISDE